MLYSISYDDGWTGGTRARAGEGLTRTETFMTEGEALTRAFRLLDEGRHHAVSLCDSSATSCAACASNSSWAFTPNSGPTIRQLGFKFR
jgi:hypothetical protein